MQEDDKEASESQPEPEGQPPSGSEADENQPEPEGQPPPATPIPLPPTQRRKIWQYLLGLVLGLIPLVVWLIFFGIGQASGGLSSLSSVGALLSGLLVAGVLYLIELVVTISYLVGKQRRFAGYGLLTAFLTTPVIIAIGCSVVLRHP